MVADSSREMSSRSKEPQMVYMLCYDHSREYALSNGVTMVNNNMITLTREKALYFIKRFQKGDINGIRGIDLEVFNAPPTNGWYIKEVPVTGVRFLSGESFLVALTKITKDAITVAGFVLYDPFVKYSKAIMFDTYYNEDIVNGS
jgi:hypothetical protein